jgi:hypothetical protein
MIDFLAKISGRNNSHNMEREELNNLRKEVGKLKKKVNYNDMSIKFFSMITQKKLFKAIQKM